MKLQEAKQNNKGFSLVELIIVIAIMAVLIAILAPQFIKYVEESRQSADLTSVEEVVNAIQVGVADPSLGISGAGEIEITTTSGTIKTQTGTEIADCLDNAKVDIGDVKLKSKEWGTVKIEIAKDGTCKVSSSGGSTNMKDKYKK